jgi:uncharacterized membrane protein
VGGVNWIHQIPAEWRTLLLGALPISEVRGAIPAGLVLGLPWREAYLWACLGNFLPVIPVLLLLEPVSARLRRFPLWRRFFEWLFQRTATRCGLIERYYALGLVLFVAIPFPITGAWTGCVAASLFRIPFRWALPAILAGILAAGLLALGAVQIGWRIFCAA